MYAAAAETARVALTAKEGSLTQLSTRFAQSRLAAVPEIVLFHSGGIDDWDITCTRVGRGSICITINGHARPLPLLSVFAQPLYPHDDQGLVLSVSVTQQLRPDWLEGDYANWMHIWSK